MLHFSYTLLEELPSNNFMRSTKAHFYFSAEYYMFRFLVIKHYISLSYCLRKFQRGKSHREKDYSDLLQKEKNSQSACPIVILFKIANSHGSKKCLVSWATQANSCQLVPLVLNMSKGSKKRRKRIKHGYKWHGLFFTSSSINKCPEEDRFCH